jgi:pectinesterase
MSKSGLLLLLFILPGMWVFSQPAGYPSSITVTQGGGGNFRTIQEAVNAVRDLSRQWVTIHIRKGVYREKVVIPSWKTMIRLVGENGDSMIIQWDDFTGKPNPGGKDVLVAANDFYAENLTIGDSVIKIFPGRPWRQNILGNG